jgi:hypothetical protein
MIIVFINNEGVVHNYYAPLCQIIDQHFCLQELRHLDDSLHHKWLEKWEPGKQSCNKGGASGALSPGAVHIGAQI